MPYECLICQKNLPTKKGLSRHVSVHGLSSQLYYDKFFRKENEGYCVCGKQTQWLHGTYQKFCSLKCAGENLDVKERRLKGLKKYYVKIKGKSFDEIYGEGAKQKLSDKMMGTHSLQWYCEKYGDEEGAKKYMKRCENISHNSYFKIYNKTNKNNYSKKSQKLFDIIYNCMKMNNEQVYYATLNHEYSCSTGHFNYDFVNVTRKKVIEFNGDKFHGNPNLYKAEDHPHPYAPTIQARDMWKADLRKINCAKNNGYDVLVIWEKDWDKMPNHVIEKCILFLLKGNAS